MELKPGYEYRIYGREPVFGAYRVFNGIRIRYIQKENINGKMWHVGMLAVRIGDSEYPTLVRLRFPERRAKEYQEGVFAGDSIVTKKILSKRNGEPTPFCPRDRRINDFIDQAWVLLKDNKIHEDDFGLRRLLEEDIGYAPSKNTQ